MNVGRFAVCGLFMVGCAAKAREAAPTPPAPPSLDEATRAHAWAELTSKLAGSWEAPAGGGRVRVRYEPISNGSALLERFFTVSGKETASVYHPAGDRVFVTHYCAQGNQPRLQLTQAGNGQLTFDFVDATDLDKGEGVMRQLVVVLREDAFDQTAIYRNGDGADESTTLHFVRTHDASKELEPSSKPASEDKPAIRPD
jgi:hypothetical protein